MLYTGYFAGLRKLPVDVIPVAICVSPPAGYNGRSIQILSPSIGCLMDWKRDHDNEAYVERYKRETLSKLDAREVESMIYRVAGVSSDHDVVLVCYEKPTDFCHRHLVADWFESNGIECREIDPIEYAKSKVESTIDDCVR